jgi:regulator of protease activity HflC (stomatin/prohibitin superfamily)
VRNKLESMRLEEILNMHSNGDAPLAALSREIESLVRQGVAAWGVEIEAVRVGSVQPVDETVSERWVQHWRAQWDRAIRHWSAQAKTSGWQAVEQARIQAELDLLLRTIEGWGELLEGDLGDESQEVLAQLLQMRFMDVLRSMAKEDPLVQMTVLEQAETLQAMLTASSQIASQEGTHRSTGEKPVLPADGT